MDTERKSVTDPALLSVRRQVSLFLAGSLAGMFVITRAGQIGSESMEIMPIVPGGIGGIVGLLMLVQVLNGLLAAGETSVALLRPVHVRHLREKGDKRGVRLQSLLDRQHLASAACQLGSRLAWAFIFLGAFLLAPYLMNAIGPSIGVEPDNFGGILLGAAAIIVFPLLPLTLIIEQGFRSFAMIHPHGVAVRLYSFIQIVSFILAVPARFATSFAKLISIRLNRSDLGVSNQAEEEIKTLVESAEESGEIEAEEKQLLHSVFEFTDTIAREVMTPRVDMDALPVNSDPAEVMKMIRETGHSRIPLFEGTDDQIVGIIHAKDLLMAMVSGRQINLRSLMRPAYFVPESKMLHELLAEMRTNRTQMAIVQDEFGGTAGILTIEDIVEELVGDIVDEYDVEEPDIVPLEEGWSVDGRMHLDDLNEAIGSAFDSEEFDTVGGLVFGAFGRHPKIRETMDLDGHRFTVLHTDGRRINRLMVEKLAPIGTTANGDE